MDESELRKLDYELRKADLQERKKEREKNELRRQQEREDHALQVQLQIRMGIWILFIQLS